MQNFLLVAVTLASLIGMPTANAQNSNSSLGVRPVAPARNPSAERLAALTGKANAGDADSQLRLGQLIEDGARTIDNKPVQQQRYSEAAKWYKLSADQGNVIAQNNYGAMLVDGRGVPEDPIEASSYYRRAAQGGNKEAQTNLAILMLRKRIPGSSEEALTTLKRRPMPALRQRKRSWLRSISMASWLRPTMAMQPLCSGPRLSKIIPG